MKPDQLDPPSPCLANRPLRRRRAAESVTVAPDGRLIMLDKFNYAWAARPVAAGGQDGGYALDPAPLAYLGPGRPLGAHFDRHGNLLLCDSLKVGCVRCGGQGLGRGVPVCYFLCVVVVGRASGTMCRTTGF